MPFMTKLAICALALFAYSAEAAPVLSGLGGKTATNAAAATDLKVFADAFVSLAPSTRCKWASMWKARARMRSSCASVFAK